MSNAQVGAVFERVIREVCESSQVDFEEGGVDQQTLEDLKKGWRKKLSSLGVAEFPWDPTPSTHTAVHAQVQQQQQAQQQSQAPPQPQPQPQPQQQQQQGKQPQSQALPPMTAPQLPGNAPAAPSNVPLMQMPQPAPSSILNPHQPPLQSPQEPAPLPSMQTAPQPAGGVQIKTEPSYAQPAPPPQYVPQHQPQQPRSQPQSQPQQHQNQQTMPGMPQNINGAAQRAASALHQRYGPAAAHQVQRLQTQAPPMPGYVATTQPMQRPAPASAGMPATISNGQHQSPQLQYQNPPPPVQQQQQQQQQQPNEQPPVPGPRPPVSNAQVDGACDANALSDWKAEVLRRREAAREQQGAGDRLIRDYVESRGLAMEGNGLMRSLQEVIRDSGKTKNRGLQVASVAEAPTASVKPRRPAGYDGADDDDDDAINSDLDDPEDPVDGEDAEGEAVGQNMLCTYDKVQRVKNKWKCTLKDGVLSCGGKEYVFHKGQGEFEW